MERGKGKTGGRRGSVTGGTGGDTNGGECNKNAHDQGKVENSIREGIKKKISVVKYVNNRTEKPFPQGLALREGIKENVRKKLVNMCFERKKEGENGE